MSKSLFITCSSNQISKQLLKQFSKHTRFLLSSRFCSSSSVSSSDQHDYQLTKTSKHVYSQLFRWNSLSQFVDTLQHQIVYNDGQLIAFDKPWGVGIHLANRRLNKQNAYEALSRVSHQPKYCVDEALPLLAERLQLERLYVLKAFDRSTSGLTLLTTDPKLKEELHRSIEYSKCQKKPHLKFDCISSGYPSTMVAGDKLCEKVGIYLEKLDKLASSKEPVITSDDDSILKRVDKAYKVQIELAILALNTELGVSHLQICSNKTRWNFVRCYASSKCAFILGDIRFAARIKQLLGQKVLVKSSEAYRDPDFEPLSDRVLRQLKVPSNRSIPLMLHLSEIRLPNFYKKNANLVIQTKRLPNHFEWTLKILNLDRTPLEVEAQRTARV